MAKALGSQKRDHWFDNLQLRLGKNSDFMTEDLRSKYTAIADDSGASEMQREAGMYLSIASDHFEKRQYDDVEAVIGNAIEIYRTLEDLDKLAESLLLQVHAVRSKAADEPGNRTSLQTLDRTIRIELQYFRDKDNKHGEVHMLVALAEILCCMKKGHCVSEALDNMLDAHDLARDIGDTKLEAVVFHELCIVMTKHHRYKAAIEAGKDAQKLFKSLGDIQKESLSWSALGEALIQNGCIEDGFQAYQKALARARELEDQKLEANCLLAMSECLMEKEEYQQGASFAEQALTIFHHLDDMQGMFSAHHLRLRGYIMMKDLVKALKKAEDGVDNLFREHGINKYFVKALSEQAKVHMYRSDRKKAKDTAVEAQERAEEITREYKDPRVRVQALERLAKIYEHFGETVEAEEVAREAADLIEDLEGYEEEAFNTLMLLAQIRIRKDDFSYARESLEKAKHLARRIQDNFLEGRALLGISGCWFGDWDLQEKGAEHSESMMHNAKKAADLALECFREECFDRGQVRVLSSAFAEFHMSERNFDLATSAVHQAFKIATDAGDKRSQALVKLQEVNILFQQDLVAQAVQVAMDSLTLSRFVESKRLTATALIYVMTSNFATLGDEPPEKRQGRVWEQTIQKLARKAKEALGLSQKVAVDAEELKASAYLWIARISAAQGLDKEWKEAAEKAKALAQDLGVATFLEIDALLELAMATDALGDRPKAQEYLEDAFTMSSRIEYESGKTFAASLFEDMVGARQDSPMSHDCRPREHDGHSSQQHFPGTERRGYSRPDLGQVRKCIADQVKTIIGKEDNAVISVDKPVIELGIDSLASVELRAQLQQEFNVSLPSSFMNDFPTVNEMAKLLVEQCIVRKVEWRNQSRT